MKKKLASSYLFSYKLILILSDEPLTYHARDISLNLIYFTRKKFKWITNSYIIVVSKRLSFTGKNLVTRSFWKFLKLCLKYSQATVFYILKKKIQH